MQRCSAFTLGDGKPTSMSASSSPRTLLISERFSLAALLDGDSRSARVNQRNHEHHLMVISWLRVGQSGDPMSSHSCRGFVSALDTEYTAYLVKLFK